MFVDAVDKQVQRTLCKTLGRAYPISLRLNRPHRHATIHATIRDWPKPQPGHKCDQHPKQSAKRVNQKPLYAYARNEHSVHMYDCEIHVQLVIYYNVRPQSDLYIMQKTGGMMVMFCAARHATSHLHMHHKSYSILHHEQQ